MRDGTFKILRLYSAYASNGHSFKRVVNPLLKITRARKKIETKMKKKSTTAIKSLVERVGCHTPSPAPRANSR